MAEFNMKVAALELAIGFYLAVQVLFAVLVGGAGFYCGHRGRPAWVRVGFVVLLVLAAAACGLALLACRDLWDYIQSRSGDPLNYERIVGDLGLARWGAVGSGVILAATVAAGLLARRADRPEPDRDVALSQESR